MPPVRPSNEPVLWLYRRISAAIFDGFGGINTRAVMDALDLYAIDRTARPRLFERILAFCSALQAAQRKSEP